MRILGAILAVTVILATLASNADAQSSPCTPSIVSTVQTFQEDRGEVLALNVNVRAVSQGSAPRLRQVRFVSIDNATVEFPFQQTRPVPSTLPLDPAASSADFIVRRTVRGRPFLLTYVATDTCGEIQRFAGAGASPGGPMNPTATPAAPTATPVPPTATAVPPTATSVPPTATAVPPTATSAHPTATPIPPTATPVPSTVTPAPTSGGTAGSFVSRQGSALTLNGQTFRFIGLNLFDAAARPGGYKCAWWDALSDADLDTTLARMRAESGATVLRFWAFQSYTSGGTDWTGIDRVIHLARKNGMWVIPVIENGMEHCSHGGTKWHNGGQWYSQAYRRDFRYGYPLSLPEYAERLVGRYRDEPTILGWMIMNEAETDNVGGMYDFAREMTALVKSIDPNHLVALGTQSSGQAGARGSDFVRVHSLPTIDFVEGHDYAYWGSDSDPLPGSPDGHSLPNPNTCDNFRAIACSISQSIYQLQKPFVMGETGIKAGVSGSISTTQRAALLDAKIRAAFGAGVAGYIPWQWNRIVDEGFDILFTDPLMPVLRQRASGL